MYDGFMIFKNCITKSSDTRDKNKANNNDPFCGFVFNEISSAKTASSGDETRLG